MSEDLKTSPEQEAANAVVVDTPADPSSESLTGVLEEELKLPPQPTKKTPMVKFRAHLVGGRIVTEQDYPSVSHLPLDQVMVLHVLECSENPHAPQIRICAELAKGERIVKFSRRHIKKIFGGSEVEQRTSGPLDFWVEVYGVKRGDEVLTYLYWHPQLGFLLTAGAELKF